MPQVGRWQTKFLLHLFILWLSIRGRYNFTHLARYGKFKESTYRKHFARYFDWLDFNTRLVDQYLSRDRIIALDPSYISKSGKHSAGVGYYWSGAAGQAKWGQEFCGLAAVDLTDKTALHLLAVQSLDFEVENPLDYYASILIFNAEKLRQVSDYVVVDAYFSKARFVDPVLEAGFNIITRLRHDQVLYYRYDGPRRPGRGAPKRYDGRIDPRNLRPDKFVPCCQAEDGSWCAYEGTAYVKAWKRWARLVVVQNQDDEGKITGHALIVSTDEQLNGGQVKLGFESRFQQEFLYRDAKQELGLEQGQAYSWQKIDYHLNCSLTVGSLAKAAHHLSATKPTDEPFSIADVKTMYVNENLALRIIRGCGICPDSPIIRRLLPEIRKLGQRRA
jgi:hypothetical protein